MVNIKLTQLLKAGTHLGHKSKSWNPKMFPYIYTERDGIHILDVIQTLQLLNEACVVVKTAAQNNKKILFIGTKPQIATIIANEAKKCNSFYINHRWLGGMLTNWKTVKIRINRLATLERQDKEGIFDILPKKEVAILKKEVTNLQNHLGGIKNMRRIPDLIIVIDQQRELTSITEARKLNIPIISILDSNCDPDLVNIPIPGNDDSIESVKLIVKMLGASIINGQSMSKTIRSNQPKKTT